MLTSYRAARARQSLRPFRELSQSQSGRLARVSEILHGIAPKRSDIGRTFCVCQFMMPLHPAGRHCMPIWPGHRKALLMEKLGFDGLHRRAFSAAIEFYHRR